MAAGNPFLVGLNGGSQDASDSQPQSQAQPPANNAQNAGPVKAGLRGVLARMLGGFSYGAGQSMLKAAGDETDAERATRLAATAHLNAQTQLVQQQAEQMKNMVPVTLPDGTTVHVPQAFGTKLLEAQIKGQYGVQGKQVTAGAQVQTGINNLRGVLAKQGLDISQDENGAVTGVKPLAELSAVQQAQTDLANAHKDVLMNPNNPTFQQKEREIRARLAMAQANLNLRQQNNQRADAQFQINNGVTPQGQPANIVGAGQMLDSNGSPIGKNFNTINGPTTQSRNMGQMAGTVIPHIDELRGEIQQNASDLGPFMGRISDAAMNGIGSTGDPAKDQRLGKLFGDIKLLTSAVARTHFGGRSGPQAVAYFHGLLNSAKSPEALQGVLDSVRPYMVGYQGMGTTKTNVNGRTPQAQPAASGSSDPFAAFGGKKR